MQTSDASFAAILRLFRAHASLEEQFSNGLGSIHGLSLKDTLLLMHVAHAEGGRLSRIELARRLSVSPSTAFISPRRVNSVVLSSRTCRGAAAAISGP